MSSPQKPFFLRKQWEKPEKARLLRPHRYGRRSSPRTPPSCVMEVVITLNDSLWAPPLIILFLAALLSSSAWTGLANAGGILLALIIVHGAPVAGASWRHLRVNSALSAREGARVEGLPIVLGRSHGRSIEESWLRAKDWGLHHLLGLTP